MPLSFEDPSIVFDVKKGTILEASAGSGKTTILTERWLSSFLYLLVWENKSVSEVFHGIIALTFTKKAAAEMKHRIRQRFHELWELNELPEFLEQIKVYAGEYPLPLDQVIHKLNTQKSVIDDLLSSARIMTINAFIFYLLRAHPLEIQQDIGLNPEESGYDISVSEKETQIELIRKLIVGEYTSIYPFFQVGVQLLGLNLWIRFFEQIRYLISRFGEDAIMQGLQESHYLDYQQQINSAVQQEDSLSAIFALLKPSIDELIKALEQENNKKSLPQDSVNLYKTLVECTSHTLLKLFTKEVQYKMKEVKDEELNQLREFCFEQYQKLIDKLYGAVIPLIVPISQQCSIELKKRQSDQGEISFGDSEMVLLDLLKIPSFLYKVQSHLRFFFADEYQDTSDIQKQLFDMIINSNHITPFFVGDPKQSIYSFRNANVYIFEQTVREFLQKNYVHKFLNTNYRSASDHVNLVNFLFTDIFANSPLSYQHQISKNSDKGVFSYTLALGVENEQKSNTQEKLQHGYFEALVFIQDLLSKGVSPGEIMVLFRNRMSILEFYRFAKEHDPQLPLSSSVKNILWDSEYISPLVSFLKVLLLSHHDLTLVELLKTPIFRKTDVEINNLLLKAKAEQCSLFEVLEEKQLINEFLILRDRIPLEELISLLIKELHYEEYLDLISETGEARATLSLFIEEAQQLQENKEMTLSDFINVIENKKNSTEEAEFSGEEGKTLRLMTIHSSKGLESSYVIYVHKPKSKEEEAKYPLYLHKKVAFDLLGKGQVAKQLGEVYLQEFVEEEKRLAYVACTRAKKQFIFCALPTLVRSSSKVFVTHWESFLNKELIEKESFYASQKMDLSNYVLEKKSAQDYQEDLSTYYKQYDWLQKNQQTFIELPQFLSISLLLDAEFSPEKFQDKYLQRSFDLIESLRELAEEEFTLQVPSQQDIGSLVHKILQEFDCPPRDEVLTYLKLHFPEYTSVFPLAMSYAYGYWESSFFKELSQQADFSEKERQVLYLLPNDIMIRSVADLYVSSAMNKNTIVDYKLSVGKNIDRYHRQLSYYALLSEKSNHPVDEIVLFSLKEAKVYPLAWNRELTEKQFNNAVQKAMELLVGTSGQEVLTEEIVKETLF